MTERPQKRGAALGCLPVTSQGFHPVSGTKMALYLAFATLLFQGNVQAQSLPRQLGPINRRGCELDSLQFSPDGTRLASATSDGTITLWNIAKGKAEATMSTDGEWVKALTFTPDGKQLISGAGKGGVVDVWDTFTGKKIARLGKPHEDIILSLAVSSNGKFVAVSGFDKTIELWDLTKHDLIGVLPGHPDFVGCMALSQDNKTLASGGGDGSVKLWNTESFKLIQSIAAHTDQVGSVTFGIDGKTVISGGWDKAIRIWDIATRKHIAELRGQSDRVIDARLSHDGQQLATLGADKQFLLWSIRERKIVRRAPGSKGEIGCACQSSDGTMIAWGDDGNMINVSKAIP